MPKEIHTTFNTTCIKIAEKWKKPKYPLKGLIIKLGHIYTTKCYMCSMKMKELEYKYG